MQIRGSAHSRSAWLALAGAAMGLAILGLLVAIYLTRPETVEPTPLLAGAVLVPAACLLREGQRIRLGKLKRT